MIELFTNPAYRHALAAGAALGVACALLSVLVVLRRWAFIGEGISHAGFGGVATAWLLSLAIPAIAGEGSAYFVAVLFCMAMALAIGWVSRRERINADAAIGIVLVGSLAWGFIALQIYQHAGSPNGPASAWDNYLLGNVQYLSTAATITAICISAAVVLVLVLMSKEIQFYCMDPELAELSGVRAGFVHYVLMLLLAMVIIVGMRLAGYLLVTALLVLPGATALALSRRLKVVLIIATAAGIIGTIGGLAVRATWTFIPSGPAMVLILTLQFILAYAWSLLAVK